MNDQNIRPYQFGGPLRSGEEAREMGRLGGINSGIARRAKRDSRQVIADALSQVPKLEPELRNALRKMGMSGKMKPDMRYICVAAIMGKAMRGDVRSFEFLVRMAGETSEAEIIDAKADEVIRRAGGLDEQASPEMDIDEIRRTMDAMSDEQLEQYEKLCGMFGPELTATADGDPQDG